MSNIIKKGMKSFHSSQLVSVCTRVVIEPAVYPQKLVCTPNLRSKGYMYPQFQNGVGMLTYAQIGHMMGYLQWVPLLHLELKHFQPVSNLNRTQVTGSTGKTPSDSTTLL